MQSVIQKKITIPIDFGMGEIVFLRCTTERKPGVVTGIKLRPLGGVSYGVSWGDNRQETVHFACELTTEFVQSFE